MVKRVRAEWLELAREALIHGGADAVSIQGLSRTLHVTRGGFYGYFGSRAALLRQLLEDWRRMNTQALRRIAARDRHDGPRQFRELVRMWVEDEDYRPDYDAAIRDWARRSSEVARTVRRVDAERIRLITRIFRNLGYRAPEAHIRARITYYHQVGYYALAIRESRPTRRRLSPAYTRVLAGAR
ncbi:MAG TPA: helix-turn-helix domain-containing protein [Steroidobacteraceae bacterium]|nr:helix-turn-helix domain-containing protein [Steroidobacteraceae bacterium]